MKKYVDGTSRDIRTYVRLDTLIGLLDPPQLRVRPMTVPVLVFPLVDAVKIRFRGLVESVYIVLSFTSIVRVTRYAVTLIGVRVVLMNVTGKALLMVIDTLVEAVEWPAASYALA
jgi:hypothetical protein